MAEYKFTAALNAATFPLVTRFQPRSVMIGQLDGKLRDPASSNQNNTDNNPQNIPQVMYCENVMPTVEGCRSVGYEQVQNAFPGPGGTDDVFILRDDAEETWYYVPAQGYNYVTPSLGTPWVSTSPVAGRPLGYPQYRASIAYVNGKTFVAFCNTWLGEWDGTTQTFIDRTAALVGVAMANVRAICGSGNYLVLVCEDNSVKWSSLTDPLDFTPSTVTGAGSQIPIDLRGIPWMLTSTSGGFIIHCFENAVAAIYTQNSAAPWIFREIKNSGGVRGGEWNIARGDNPGSVFQWGTNGLQSLNLREAENVHTNFTEFITSKVLEDFNSGTNLLGITHADLFVKVAYVLGRYLCLSYTDVDSYKYALIYDYSLKRWGKLKFTHGEIFASIEQAGVVAEMHIVKQTGEVYRVILDGDAPVNESGVLILGRYQLSRTSQICSQQLELEVLDAADAVTAHVATNYNGTTVGQVLPMTLYASSDNYRCFQKQIEGDNLSYIIKGSFNLASAIITATRGARS